MFPVFRTILYNATRSTLQIAKVQTSINLFHSLSKVPQNELSLVRNLLTPTNISVVPSCGFKVKGILKRRCKDCYFVRREDRLFVICNTHPRHKQMQMVKKEKNTWILSHATQSKVRPW